MREIFKIILFYSKHDHRYNNRYGTHSVLQCKTLQEKKNLEKNKLNFIYR